MSNLLIVTDTTTGGIALIETTDREPGVVHHENGLTYTVVAAPARRGFFTRLFRKGA